MHLSCTLEVIFHCKMSNQFDIDYNILLNLESLWLPPLIVISHPSASIHDANLQSLCQPQDSFALSGMGLDQQGFEFDP